MLVIGRVARRLGAIAGPSSRVRFARARALTWIIIGVISFPIGWADSVILVWIASVYANVASEIAAGEAADDDRVIQRLARIERHVTPRGRRRAAAPPSIRSPLCGTRRGLGRHRPHACITRKTV